MPKRANVDEDSNDDQIAGKSPKLEESNAVDDHAAQLGADENWNSSENSDDESESQSAEVRAILDKAALDLFFAEFPLDSYEELSNGSSWSTESESESPLAHRWADVSDIINDDEDSPLRLPKKSSPKPSTSKSTPEQKPDEEPKRLEKRPGAADLKIHSKNYFRAKTEENKPERSTPPASLQSDEENEGESIPKPPKKWEEEIAPLKRPPPKKESNQ